MLGTLKELRDTIIYRLRRLRDRLDRRSVTYLPSGPFQAPGLDIRGYSVDEVLKIRQAWVNERAELQAERAARETTRTVRS